MMTFTKAKKRPGSSKVEINVSKGGAPFGMLWTWANTRTEWHPWHAKPLNGEHATFDNLAAAKAHMASL